ncbi:zinc-ribbon domain-containing protein [Clostridium perfringens]
MSKKKTHEEFVEEVRDKYGDEYIILGKYINSKTKILVKHNKCSHEYKVDPNALLRGNGCPACKIINSTLSNDEFQSRFYEKYGDEFTLLDEYRSSRDKMRIRHNCDYCGNHIRVMRADAILKKLKCRVCNKLEENKVSINNQLRNRNLELLDEIILKNDKYKFKCLKCNYTWMAYTYNILKGSGCPRCSGRIAILGINTIWDTDRWMCNLGVSEEDAKKYSSRSGQKIKVKCPDCGREKKVVVHQIFDNKSISCSCGDGKSYPEKFVMNVLEQLDLKFETEYSLKWINNKRYDFYIKDIDCIIEANGKQHYDGSFKVRGGRTLEEEQQNDKLKKEIALQNGVKYYIELDCRESEMEYIKNSILNSELAKLFDLSNINWTGCAKFANSNIVKEVCDYWNNKRKDETTTDLMKRFKLGRPAVVNYLKRGTKLGWCNYNPKEEMKKIGYNCGKKVEIFKDGQSLGIFSSCLELERRSEELFGVKLLGQNISNVCNDKQKHHKGFTFKYVD